MSSIPLRPNDRLQHHPAGTPADSIGLDTDETLWRQFIGADTPEAFCKGWLALQCSMLTDVRAGMVLLGSPDRGPYTPAAVWPHTGRSVRHLTAAAERALRERRGLLIKNDSPHDSDTASTDSYHVTYPIEVSGKLHGVVVLEVGPRPKRELQEVLRQLHWGAAWLEVMFRRRNALRSAATNERLQNVLNLVAAAVEHERFQPAAMEFVTALSTKLDCERVSLGFVERRYVRIAALSHSADFSKQMNLVRSIGSAMDEAIDQHSVVVYPLTSEDEPMIVRAHDELSRQHGSGAICTIPLGSHGKLYGALTLERPADKTFDPATVELCEVVSEVVGPILETKRQNNRLLVTKIAEALRQEWKKLVGPGHPAFKSVMTVLGALLVFFIFAEAEYRITAPSLLEGIVQRVVVAPFEGYVAEAPKRAGDLVSKGEVLCMLDDRDMKLERLKWSTEREQLVKQYREAMAKHDRPQIRIVKAKIDQAEAQLALLDEQLARTRIVAPIDGLVVSGDLSQALGAPLERGRILFEVAPLDAYRLIVEVDERDIAEVAAGQMGELVLSSIPDKAFPFVVDKVTPVSTPKEGRNCFRVESRLEETSDRLRPGMEGVGKITIDRRRVVWIWTHELTDWVRLQLWSLTP